MTNKEFQEYLLKEIEFLKTLPDDKCIENFTYHVSLSKT